MAALWQQRRELIEENAQLVQQWLDKLDEHQRVTLLRSLVDRYSLPELRAMNTHIKERLAVMQQSEVEQEVFAHLDGEVQKMVENAVAGLLPSQSQTLPEVWSMIGELRHDQ